MDSFVEKMVTSLIMNSERGKGLWGHIHNLRQNALMGSEVAFISKIYVSGFAYLIVTLAECKALIQLELIV